MTQNEKDFWHQIVTLKLMPAPARDRVVSMERYDVLFSLTDDLYSSYEAGGFVKLVASLSKGTYDELANGLIDLKEHHWDVEAIFSQSRRSYQTRFHSYMRGYSHSTRELVKEWRHAAVEIEAGRHAFLEAHKIFLLKEQRAALFAAPEKLKIA